MNSPKPDGTNSRKSRIRFVLFLLLATLVLWLAVSVFRTMDREQAAADLRKMGFEAGSESIIQVIRKNWRGAYRVIFSKKRQEWNDRARLLFSNVTDLNGCAPTLIRFKPREILLGFCGNLEDVSALRNFPDLERLDFYDCPKVTDVGIVSHFVKLRELTFRKNPALRSLDIIKSGSHLKSLHISNCQALVDLNGT
jgi:hypothetical protein